MAQDVVILSSAYASPIILAFRIQNIFARELHKIIIIIIKNLECAGYKNKNTNAVQIRDVRNNFFSGLASVRFLK